MPFLLSNPLLLAALAGIGIPIAVHLLMKRKQVRMRFSTVRFFVQDEPKARSKRKLRNLLLLLLRLLVFALIVLAFTRPYLPLGAGAGRRNPKQVVVVLDRSLSMQARDGAGTRWETARNRIRQQLDALTSADRVALVTTAARTETVTPFSPPSVVAARLSELTPTHTAGDLAPGLREAVRLLTQAERGPDPSILLVSDLQRDAVQSLDSAPVPPGIDLRVVAIGDLLTPNLSVADLRLDSGETNRPFATIASHSDEPAKSLEARLSVDGKPVWTRPLSLGPGASTNLALDLPPLPQGWHQAEVRLAQDDNLTADNTRTAVFYVPPPIRVLLVEGRRGVRSFEEQSFFLAAALDPNAGSTNATPNRFRVEKVDPSQLAARLALVASSQGAATNLAARIPFDAVFLPAQRSLPPGAPDALARFVQAGGGLALFVSPELVPATFNNTFGDLLPAQLLRSESAEIESPWRLGLVDRSTPVFDAFKLPNSGNLAIAEFLRRFVLEPARGVSVLARFDDGMPAVLSRTVGSGRVLLINTSPDNTGSDWPKHKTFVPAIHGIARHLAGRTDDRLLLAGLAVTLGDEAELPAPAGESSGRKLVGPDGRERPAPPEEAGLIHLEPDLPGAWSLHETNRAPLLQLAAQLPPSESVLESARPDEITRRIPRRDPAAAGDIAVEWTGNDRQRLEYWRPLLLAAILLLLAETIVANRSTT